jgi:multiple antibiotic resistance protein
MIKDLQDFFSELVMMWVLIDPIGTLPIFLHATQDLKPEQRKRVAIRATIIAGIILSFFSVLGNVLLRSIGIPIPAFQIAGGVIVFLFALTMIFGETKPETESQMVDPRTRENNIAVFPLAIPTIAGPAAILGAVLLSDSEAFSFGDHAESIVEIFLVLAAGLVILLLAGRIFRLIGESGTSVLTRIMGLLLAAVAANNVLEAVTDYFNLGGSP